MLCYKKIALDIKDIEYVKNPCDACIANKMINNNQYTLDWHADDAKSSHVSPKVNGEFANGCEEKNGSDDPGHATLHREKRHD